MLNPVRQNKFDKGKKKQKTFTVGEQGNILQLQTGNLTFSLAEVHEYGLAVRLGIRFRLGIHHI